MLLHAYININNICKLLKIIFVLNIKFSHNIGYYIYVYDTIQPLINLVTLFL